MFGFEKPGVTYTRIGNTIFGSDGSSHTITGNTIFNSDGSTIMNSGNTSFRSDGSSLMRTGNTTFDSNGTSYIQSGNTTFGSDRTTRIQSGNTDFGNQRKRKRKMSEDIRLETNFEHYISRKLQELSDTGDWQVSQNDDGFDPNTGLVMDDFVAYVNAVSPQKSEDLDDEDYEPFPDSED